MGIGMGMLLGTYGAEMLGEFGGMTDSAFIVGAAEAVAVRTSVFRYKAGNLSGSFRTGNAFAGSLQYYKCFYANDKLDVVNNFILR